MRRRAILAMVFGAAPACSKDRPAVEAPVIDVAVADVRVDASVRPDPSDPVPSRATSGSGPRVVGRWIGVGQQDDGQSWDLRVEITGTNGVCARAEYPTVPCAAEWVCEGEDDGGLRARERLLDDSALRCIDNGTMTMRVGSDGQLEWTWTGQGQNAHAKLRRAF